MTSKAYIAQTTAAKTMTSKSYIAQTTDYGVVIVEVASQMLATGIGKAYGIENKKTAVVEAYVMTLPEALRMLELAQSALDEATGKTAAAGNAN
jgi:hypothetical protein